ncbi:hypothetical protein OSB04_016762 [Centaurea solstitialis]|uniref:CCHC-type domain-containing protein n=1 Tax=Centaurea solstitialis TaxID=347529 RepID=A0AA38TJR2_9ASTR|nr:hypothetical protein OSB04_016762 [Centaurea solstitialis]
METSEKICPPIIKRPPGRPKKNRIVPPDEPKRRHKCRRCGMFGHHERTCKNSAPLDNTSQGSSNKRSTTILPVVQKQHQLLVTLLLCKLQRWSRNLDADLDGCRRNLDADLDDVAESGRRLDVVDWNWNLEADLDGCRRNLDADLGI